MCRFLAYLGKRPRVLADYLDKPIHSLLKQSQEARACALGTHADGSGIAWYSPSISPEPGIYKTTQPAWNDENLHSLIAKIESTCFLGHARAASSGEVNFNNCHPFAFGNYAFMHNGTIEGLEKFRRAWLWDLDEDLFEHIRGRTDSELLFHLMIHHMRRSSLQGLAAMQAGLHLAFEQVRRAQSHSQDIFASLNIVLTDGENLIATRYSTKQRAPASLSYRIEESESGNPEGYIIASEITHEPERWCSFKESQGISLDAALKFQTFSLE